MGLFDDLFKKKDITEKINFLGKKYEINPDAMVFSQKGLDKYQQKDYFGAVTEFTKAIKAQPENQNLYIMRGTSYEDLGNDIEAEKDFRKTLELLPNDRIASYRLGMVCVRKKDFENAVKWLKVSYNNALIEDLSELGIGNNNIFFVHKKIIACNLGNILTQLERFEEGFSYLDEAIKLDPKYYNAYGAKGIAYAQMGKPKEGIIYLKKAEELGDPMAGKSIKLLEQLSSKGNAESYYQSGIAKHDIKDTLGAIKDYSQAITIDPNYTDAYYNRGTVKYEIGDNAGALEDFDKTIQIDPNYAKAYFNRGVVKLNFDKNAARLDLLKAADFGISQAYDIIKQYCK